MYYYIPVQIHCCQSVRMICVAGVDFPMYFAIAAAAAASVYKVSLFFLSLYILCILCIPKSDDDARCRITVRCMVK